MSGEAIVRAAFLNSVLHYSIGDALATGVDEVSLLNVSALYIFALMIAPCAHEEH